MSKRAEYFCVECEHWRACECRLFFITRGYRARACSFFRKLGVRA